MIHQNWWHFSILYLGRDIDIRSSATLNVLTEREERGERSEGRKEGERDTFLSLLIAALSLVLCSAFCSERAPSGDLFSAAFFALPRRYKSPPPICAPACELAKEPMHSRGTNRFAKRETHSKPTSSKHPSPKMIRYSADPPPFFYPRSN